MSNDRNSISANKARYRLYIDESGSYNYPTKNWNNPSQRYLSLTGVIIESVYYGVKIQPAIKNIKSLVTVDPDEPPILHREDIRGCNGNFSMLKEKPKLKEKFDQLMLELLESYSFKICTVVLDKKSHLERYQDSARNPYHYSLAMLLERYVHFLHSVKSRGDVMVEARGGKEDKKLEEEYRQFYSKGTYYLSPHYIAEVITSNSIKVKRKRQAIAGLEIADLLTLPTKIDVLNCYGVIKKLDSNFQTKIIGKIQDKYLTGSGTKESKGHGKKFI